MDRQTVSQTDGQLCYGVQKEKTRKISEGKRTKQQQDTPLKHTHTHTRFYINKKGSLNR